MDLFTDGLAIRDQRLLRGAQRTRCAEPGCEARVYHSKSYCKLHLHRIASVRRLIALDAGRFAAEEAQEQAERAAQRPPDPPRNARAPAGTGAATRDEDGQHLQHSADRHRLGGAA